MEKRKDKSAVSALESARQLLEREIVEVTGCTEVAGIALAVSRAAARILRDTPGAAAAADKLSVSLTLSENVYRNASTVTSPVIRRMGIKPAAACGLFATGRDINVFASVPESALESIREMVSADSWLSVSAVNKPGVYIRAEICSGDKSAHAVIDGYHDTVVSEGTIEKELPAGDGAERFSLKGLGHILEIVERKDAGLENLADRFLGFMGEEQKKHAPGEARRAVMELVRMRMEGASLRVLTVTGSGNQGIFLSLPFCELRETIGSRAIPGALFSLLTQIYLTQKEGRLSGACGLANKAAPALAAGLSYLEKLSLEGIADGMDLVRESLKGMVCEGAERSCAYKANMALELVRRIVKGE